MLHWRFCGWSSSMESVANAVPQPIWRMQQLHYVWVRQNAGFRFTVRRTDKLLKLHTWLILRWHGLKLLPSLKDFLRWTDEIIAFSYVSILSEVSLAASAASLVPSASDYSYVTGFGEAQQLPTACSDGVLCLSRFFLAGFVARVAACDVLERGLDINLYLPHPAIITWSYIYIYNYTW